MSKIIFLCLVFFSGNIFSSELKLKNKILNHIINYIDSKQLDQYSLDYEKLQKCLLDFKSLKPDLSLSSYFVSFLKEKYYDQSIDIDNLYNALIYSVDEDIVLEENKFKEKYDINNSSEYSLKFLNIINLIYLNEHKEGFFASSLIVLKIISTNSAIFSKLY